MLNPSLQNTRDWGPRWVFTCTRHTRIVGGARVRWKRRTLENAREGGRILLKITETIIKISVSHDLCTIAALLLLQAHGLEHVCIIMELEWSTANIQRPHRCQRRIQELDKSKLYRYKYNYNVWRLSHSLVHDLVLLMGTACMQKHQHYWTGQLGSCSVVTTLQNENV